jgi:imidazoleglycerol-phosphate dehydratase
MRSALLQRKTKETEIETELCIDGSGIASIETGIGFFDHMLSSFALHAAFNLKIRCNGDLTVDSHHTVEDVGILLGKAFAQAVKDRSKIARYGSAVIPMDESLARAVVDVCGRSFLYFDADFREPMIGTMGSQMIEEFWRAFSTNAQLTLHIELLYGKNDHHKAEAIFKAAAHALRQAVVSNEKGVLSVKGAL